MQTLYRFLTPIIILLLNSTATAADDKKQQNKSAKSTTPPTVEKENKESESFEKFVMPFTKWVEGQLHNSPLINPTQNTKTTRQNAKSQNKLRLAIKAALVEFPGIVLSATKHQKQESTVYQIKIISTDGIIKVISITDSEMNGD